MTQSPPQGPHQNHPPTTPPPATSPPPVAPPPVSPPPYFVPQGPEKNEKNTVALIAFVAAIVGFVFACIPGALIIGWILLPISFILAVVSLFSSGKKGLGIAALIISIVGTLVGVIVFLAVVTDAVDDAFSDGGTNVTAPAGEADEGKGTRDNPHPVGSTIESDNWALTINGVNLDANAAVASENSFNDAAPDGRVYILANVTLTYTGDDPAGAMPTQIIEYVTVDGNTINSYDTFVVVPDEFDSLTTLYEGASTTGNIGFAVPADSAAQGVLAVSITMFGDKVFVAVQ